RPRPACPVLLEIVMHRSVLVGLLTLLAGSNVAWAQREAAPRRMTAEGGIKELKSADPARRRQAAGALGALGPGGKAAIPSLAAALRDDDEGVCLAAALALGTMGSDARAAVPALAERVKDQKQTVRHAALVALSAIGPGAKAAVPAARDALQDKDERV